MIKYLKISFLLGSFLLLAQQKKSIVPLTYVAHKVAAPLTIDGKPDDLAWQKASWTADFIDIEGLKKPTYRTHVKMLWDDTYFYIFAKITEPHIWADLKKHDAIIFHNNDFELFIDPDNDTKNYYEFEINALGTTWDLFLNAPYRIKNNVVLNDWEMTGLKSAVHIEGTLNNPKDTDKYWTVELAIPWAVYKTDYFHNNVPKNKFWRVNFSRVNWDFELDAFGNYQRKKDAKGKYHSEYNWVWSPQGVVNMHQPETWGYVFFSDKPLGTSVAFKIPDDEHLRWQLYAYYRKQLTYKAKNKAWATNLKAIGGAQQVVKGKNVTFQMESHRLGWHIFVQSPFTGKKYVITEQGT